MLKDSEIGSVNVIFLVNIAITLSTNKKALPGTLDNASKEIKTILFYRNWNIPIFPTQNNRILVDIVNQTFGT